MPGRIVGLLEDVQDSMAAITRVTKGKSLDDYLADDVMRRAIERWFEIAGEALTRLKRERPDLFARLTDAKQVVGFRNVLAHNYDTVDDSITWQVIQDGVPVLHEEVTALIAEFPPFDR